MFSCVGSSDSQEIASVIAHSGSSSSRDSQITELTEYVRAAVELADAMSQAQESQVLHSRSDIDCAPPSQVGSVLITCIFMLC